MNGSGGFLCLFVVPSLPLFHLKGKTRVTRSIENTCSTSQQTLETERHFLPVAHKVSYARV